MISSNLAGTPNWCAYAGLGLGLGLGFGVSKNVKCMLTAGCEGSGFRGGLENPKTGSSGLCVGIRGCKLQVSITGYVNMHASVTGVHVRPGSALSAFAGGEISLYTP